MTTLTITPNYEKKRLKLEGTVAAGEHVAVTVKGAANWIKPDNTSETQTLRLRVLFADKTVAIFPIPADPLPLAAESNEGEESETSDAGDESNEWTLGTDTADAVCELDLFTIPAEKYLKFGGNCFWVLDDPENNTLYGTGEFEVLPWPKRRGSDVPYDLDEYPDIVDQMRNEWVAYKASVNAAMSAHETTVAGQIATKADASALTALAGVVDGKVDKISGKGLSKNDYTDADKGKLDGIAAGAEVNVQSDWNQGETSAKDFIKNKPTALKNPAALTFGGKTYDGSAAKEITAADLGALTSHQDISSKADKITTYTKAEVDAIVAAVKTGSRQVVASLSDVTDPQPLVIYMVAKSPSQTNNAYDEYIWLPSGSSGSWEKIGDTEIDLTGYVQTSDSRLSDARTPTAHKSSHATGGSDALTPADIGAQPAGSYATAAQGALAESALQSHQQLAPVYSQTPTFSEWSISSDYVGQLSIAYDFSLGVWKLLDSVGAQIAFAGGTTDAVSLEFFVSPDAQITYATATRTRTDIIGYTLGTQSPHLQPQGEYASAADLTSLASTVAGKAAAADLRYAFAAPLPDANDRVELVDRASNRFTGTSQYSPWAWNDEGDYGDPVWDDTNSYWLSPAALDAAYADSASPPRGPITLTFSSHAVSSTATEAAYVGFSYDGSLGMTITSLTENIDGSYTMGLAASNGWACSVTYSESTGGWMAPAYSDGVWTVHAPDLGATPPSFGTIFCEVTGEATVIATRSLRTLGTFVPPAAAPGHLRDFLVRLDLTGVSGTAPSIGWSASDAGSAAVSYEAKGGTFPEFEAGVVNFVSFTEFEPGVLTVKHETVEEVTIEEEES